jgi:uncharacterized protein (TIGR00369 family)
MSTEDQKAPDRVSDSEMLERFLCSNAQPAGSKTLGFTMLRIDQAAMEVEVGFTGLAEFCNPMGQIQGGFLVAMLDDAMSVAGAVASNLTCVMPTLEMKTSFLRPAWPGPLRVVGRVLKWGKTIAFTEGLLFDDKGTLLAKASATAKPALLSKFR